MSIHPVIGIPTQTLHAIEGISEALPQARLSAENGQQVDARQLRGRVSVVEFIYTRCTTACLTLGSVFGAVQREFPDAIATGRLQLLSIGVCLGKSASGGAVFVIFCAE